MPNDSGSVGGGSQNRYEPVGEIICADARKTKIKFRKGPRREGTDRDLAPCWNAGTPVAWTGTLEKDEQGRVDGRKIFVTKADVPVPAAQTQNGKPGTISILATLNSDGSVKEYHPLIEFFNEVMAGIIRDNMTKDLDNLDRPSSARRLWEYLDQKYLKGRVTIDLTSLLELIHKEQLAEKITEKRELDWENVGGMMVDR